VQAIVSVVSEPTLTLIGHTSASRSVSGFVWVYCTIFPPGIHGLMMQNRNGTSAPETPMMGSTFGWEMDLYSLILRGRVWYEAQ
jgi:hypothetical protein